MKYKILLLFFVFTYNIGFSQVEQGGTPYSSSHYLPALTTTVSLPEIDLEKLQNEDAIFDLQKNVPYRFGYNFNTNFTPSNSGKWEHLKNGDKVWRLAIVSENAQSLNFLFENFQLAKGASLFIYNEDKHIILGSFTYKNNRKHKKLSTFPLPGEKFIIEYFQPANTEQSTFEISRVTHGYRSFKPQTKDVNDSGDCNNNVICAVGDNWRNEIRSVGIILVNGNSSCTGAMINNTCHDKKPYFLTADHCTGSDVSTWSVGFNFESTDCATNTGFNANNFQSVNVLEMKVQDEDSDFALVELVQIPPVSYNVYYAGWDKSGNTPTSQVAIHHPRGDLKKISFDTDSATKTNWSGAACWKIADWEDGTTEPGSSGSPLFDQNKKIIGQLYGGTATCDNNIDDYYGRLDVSWNLGLSTFLDPLGINPDSLGGLDASFLVADDVSIKFLNKPKEIHCSTNIPQEILITNNGINTLTNLKFNYGLINNIQNYTWTGSLSTGASETITLEAMVLCNGLYDYSLQITEYNDSMDLITCNNTDNFSFEIINGSELIVFVKTNMQGSETSFDIKDENDNIIYSETNFNNNANHTFNYCVPRGNYSFTIYDTGNNGLTPTFFFDAGNYSITLDGIELINNDDFGSEETTNFFSEGSGFYADFYNDTAFYAGAVLNITSTYNTSNTLYYEWQAPDAAITSSTDSVFNTLFNTPGTFPVTLQLQSDSFCDIVTKELNIIKNTVHINNIISNKEPIIFPNPTQSFISIDLVNFDNATYTLRNYLGKNILEGVINKAYTEVSLVDVSKGVYFIEIKQNGKVFVEKIVVN